MVMREAWTHLEQASADSAGCQLSRQELFRKAVAVSKYFHPARVQPLTWQVTAGVTDSALL